MINSVLKAIDLLHVFTPAEPRLSLAEISGRLGLPKSTAHHLLSTLLSRRFVEKVDADHYALGTAIIPLTQAARVNAEVRDRAAPLLRDLADACRESVYLTVLDGDYSLYIYAVESPQRLLARTAVGDRALLHCTSVGKATLALLPAERVAGIVERVGLPAFTPYTITAPEQLRDELASIRVRGFAFDREEHELGTFCVAAPFRDTHGRVLGAMSVSGATPEIVGARASHLSTLVMGTAQEVSRRMGHVPDSLSLVAPALVPLGE